MRKASASDILSLNASFVLLTTQKDFNNQLIGIKNLMIPLSRSYIELEEWVLARNTLINLRKAVPKIEFDQDYIDTALLLKQRMVKAGVIE